MLRKVAVLSALLFAVLAASAQAHTAVAKVACGSITVTWENFASSGSGNHGLNTPTWTVAFTPTGAGSPTFTRNGQVSFPGSTYTLTIHLPHVNGTVAGRTAWTSSQTRDHAYGSASGTFTIDSCTKPTPTISTSATPSSATVGTPLTDSATLSGGHHPTGTITWRLYGPNDPSCSNANPPSVSVSNVNGDGNYVSPAITPTQAGTYEWIASYSGDADNNPVSGDCGDSGETVTLMASPALSTTATPSSATVGQSITDVAHLTGGSDPTGTITFNLYGPSPNGCTGTPAATVTSPVDGDGDYPSPAVPATGPGIFAWVASYSGDANNTPLSSACSEPSETVTVVAQPTVTTTATPGEAAVGESIADVAHLSGGSNPSGTITFTLYGPNDSTCSNAPVATVSSAVNGDGDYTSPTVTTTADGSFVWVASYSGDAANAPYTSSCSDANETVTVTTPTGPNVVPPPPPPTSSFTMQKLQTVNDSDQPFTANPITVDVGQQINYEIVVTNTGQTPLVLSLVDTLCSSIAGPTGPIEGGALISGGTATYTCVHVVAASDSPRYVNVAQITAAPPGGANLAPERSSVIANIPSGGVQACVVSKSVIKQSTVTKNKVVAATVSGKGIDKVVFYVDGRETKTLTKPNSSKGFQLKITLSGLRYGDHSVVAKVSTTCGTAQTDGVTIRRNAPARTIVPNFTG